MRLMIGVCCGLALIGQAVAQEEVPPPVKTQTFKLNAVDGCYRYVGNAVEFIGRLRAGSYIGVTMDMLDANGMPLPRERDDRVPVMDAPEYKTKAAGFWFGPLAASRDYGITFIPRAMFGSSAVVGICGRMAPPQEP